MSAAALEAALAEAASLRKVLANSATAQVRASDERALVKATALSWFNAHRPTSATMLPSGTLDALDVLYKELLAWCERATVRDKYLSQLKRLKETLVAGRSDTMVIAATAAAYQASEQPPNFTPLVSDKNMQAILTRRWLECVTCVQSKAPLAATVMMGGLLEGVLLARIHQAPNKAPIFQAASAPRDPRTRKTRPLPDWMLKDFIDVAHELKWITVSVKSVSVVLRDYRNYIHPHKELSHGVILQPDDALLLWELSKTIVRQVLKGTP